MSKFKLEDVPVMDMQALGLHNGKDFLLPQKNIEQLLSGKLTDFVKMEDVKIAGIDRAVSLDAKLTLRAKDDGSTGLLIHPIYKERMNHPELTQGEADQLEKGGILRKSTAAYGKILEHGPAPYEFDKENSPSYYIKLEKLNGDKSTIWGVELADALARSGKKTGDLVQIEHKGKQAVEVDVPIRNEQKEITGYEKQMVGKNMWEIGDYQKNRQKETFKLYEYDRDTKSFVTVSDREIQELEEVNGIPLTKDQKRRFKEGESVELQEGTVIKASPKSSLGFVSNRTFLYASLFLDGGLSYATIQLTDMLLKLGSQKLDRQPTEKQNKDYMDQLKAIKVELTDILEANPENKKVANDLSVLNKIISGESLVEEKTTAQDIKDVKTAVNDPELKSNVEREHREEVSSDKLDQEVKPTEQKDMQHNIKHEAQTLEDNLQEKIIVEKTITVEDAQSQDSAKDISVRAEAKMTHVAYVKSMNDGTLYIDQQSGKENDRRATFEVVQDTKGGYFYTLNESNKEAMVSALSRADSFLNPSVAETINNLNRPTIENKPYTSVSYMETKYKPVEKIDNIHFKVTERLEIKGVYSNDFAVLPREVMTNKNERDEHINAATSKEQHADISEEQDVNRSTGFRR